VARVFRRFQSKAPIPEPSRMSRQLAKRAERSMHESFPVSAGREERCVGKRDGLAAKAGTIPRGVVGGAGYSQVRHGRG